MRCEHLRKTTENERSEGFFSGAGNVENSIELSFVSLQNFLLGCAFKTCKACEFWDSKKDNFSNSLQVGDSPGKKSVL